jgi:2-oxoisovalerate ferredoxin oxidoreductase beta subunit
MQTRQLIRKVLQAQKELQGFTFLEILSQCPSNWKVTPDKSAEWMEKYSLPYFKLGVFKDELAARPPRSAPSARIPNERILEVLDTAAQSGRAVAGKEALPRMRVITAGFGGQGVLLLGGMIAKSAMSHGYNVTWLPSYGPEMRGGTANCSVVLDREPIGSPIVERPDLLVAMNGPSLRKFADKLAAGGLILYNASIADTADLPAGVHAVPVMATNLAKEAGSERAANAVMLGAVTTLYPWFDADAFRATLRDNFPRPDLQELNLRAFEAGRAAVR